MTATSLVFAPLLPLWAIAALGAAGALLVALALVRGQRGAWLRALALMALLAALSGPSLQREERQKLTDIVVAVVDGSASQSIAGRPAQVAAALAALQRQVAARPDTELRVTHLGDGPDDAGTLLMQAVAEAIAAEPQGRLAGVVMISDGRLHDAARAPALPVPAHLLLTGEPDDWDRRLVVRNAPEFAILGEQVTLTVRLEDQGAAPDNGGLIPLDITIDGGAPQSFQVPAGRDVDLPLSIPHGGMNVLQFSTPEVEGELTGRNNVAVIQINGLRDRLRVLLVSGEPNPGERTWRNILKSDPAIDLVHFTILRPPEKQDGVPVDELSLIAFPTRELFVDKLDDFDLVIFDRYRRRGILPTEYFDNIARYVREGGAVLVSSGPEYAGAESIYRSPLGYVLPGAPTARVLEEPFRPALTEPGLRHPVTAGLTGANGAAEEEATWGRWFRLIDVQVAPGALALMSGAEARPLLMLQRVDEGRVALIASDQAWLWDRGHEGGGPQQELLRRLAHWLMKEPELEEEALWAEPMGQSMTIVRRTMDAEAGPVELTGPDGALIEVPLAEVSPGRFEAHYDAPEMGLYRLRDGDAEAVIALGPAAPREFEATIASGDAILPLIAPTGGAVTLLSDGIPDLRDVRAGRPAAGRGWIGIIPRGASNASDISLTPLLPPWAFLLLSALLVLGAWLREARREVRPAFGDKA